MVSLTDVRIIIHLHFTYIRLTDPLNDTDKQILIRHHTIHIRYLSLRPFGTFYDKDMILTMVFNEKRITIIRVMTATSLSIVVSYIRAEI